MATSVPVARGIPARLLTLADQRTRPESGSTERSHTHPPSGPWVSSPGAPIWGPVQEREAIRWRVLEAVTKIEEKKSL